MKLNEDVYEQHYFTGDTLSWMLLDILNLYLDVEHAGGVVESINIQPAQKEDLSWGYQAYVTVSV